MFQIGEFVVYGFSGVCRVEEITEMEVPGSSRKKPYYTLLPVHSKASRVFAPVEGKKVIRNVMSREEAEAFLKKIPDITPLEISHEKCREETYKESIRMCDPIQWVRLIKTLYERRKQRIVLGKQSTAMDSRYLKSVEDYLFGELSVAFDMEPLEVETMLKELV